MPVFEMRSPMLPCAETVFNYHARPGAFQRLTPPWQRIRLIRASGGIRDGDVLEFQICKGPLRLTWHAVHQDFREAHGFSDKQTRGPFKHWLHEHRFLPSGNGTMLLDRVHYELPLAPLLSGPSAPMMNRVLRKLFRFRHQRTRADLELQAPFAQHPGKTLVFFGAMSPLTRDMAAFLSTCGHRVFQQEDNPSEGNGNRFHLLPYLGRGRHYPLEEADVLIHTNRSFPDEAGSAPNGCDYLEYLVRALETGSNRPPLLLHLHRRFQGPDYTDNPGLDFRKDRLRNHNRKRREALLDRLADLSGHEAHLHLGHLIGPPMSHLVRLLLELETYLFLQRDARSPYFHWISRQDAIGAFHHLIHQVKPPTHLALVAPQPASRAQLQRLLLARNFLGYSFNRLLKVFPWAFPGQTPDRDPDLDAMPRLSMLDYPFLTPDLSTALAHEYGEVVNSWPGAFEES